MEKGDNNMFISPKNSRNQMRPQTSASCVFDKGNLSKNMSKINQDGIPMKFFK